MKVEAGDGTAPYSVSTTTGGLSGTINTSGGSLTLSAPAGSYTVVVTDAVGSSTTSAVLISGPPAGPTIALSGTNVCAGLPVPLSATSGLASYTFISPAPGVVTPSGNRASVSALTGGPYTFTVLVTNADGCTAVATRNVTVNANPTVTASNNGPLCAPTDLGNPTLILSSTATGSGLTYRWSGPVSVTNSTGIVGAAIPGFGINSSFRTLFAVGPSATGTYTVVVTNGQGCTATATTSVTVNRSLTPTFTASSFCLQAQPILTASVTNTNPGDNLQYEIALNGTVISTSTTTATSLTYAALQSGNYSLTVSNLSTGICPRTQILNPILPGPNAPTVLNTTAQLKACEGAAISVTATCGLLETPVVTGAFASSTGSGTVVVFTTSTTAGIYSYSVACRGLLGCLSTSVTPVSATVSPLPTPQLVSNSPLCADGTLSLTATGGVSYTYVSAPTLSFVGGTASVVTVSMPTPGVYSVTVTASNADGCTAAAQTSVTVNALPSLTLTSNSVVCVGTNVTLTAGGANSYSFSGPSIGSPTTNPNVVTGLAVGTHTFTLSATSVGGCVSTTTTSVTVNAYPVPTLSASPSTTVTCLQPSVTLTAGGGGTYVFRDGGGTTIASVGNQAVINVGGTYSVIVTTNGCSSTTSLVIDQTFVGSPLTVGDPPASLGGCLDSPITVPVGFTGTALGFQWYKDGLPVSGQTTATLTFGSVQSAQAGSYLLVVTGACISATTAAMMLTVNSLPNVTLVFNNQATVMNSGVPIITIPPGPGQAFQVFGGIFYERVRLLDRINGYEIRAVDQSTTGIFTVEPLGPFTIIVTDANGCRRTVQGVIANP